MSLYHKGAAHEHSDRHMLVGASQEQPQKKKGMATILIVLGLTAVVYVGIPMLNKKVV